MASHVWSAPLLAVVVGAYQPTTGVAADFYSGKTLILTASSDPGAGYDSYVRLLGRHIARHIPGTPNIVVQNEPGGGGLRVAQIIYAIADKDGTKVGNLRASNMLDSIVGIRGAEIDPRKYEWIGNMASDTDMCSFWHTAGVRTFEDLRTKEVIVGASGKGAQNYSFPNAMNKYLGTKMKIIVGYKGAADRVLALERGELQGNCGINASTLNSGWPQLVEEGKLIPVVQSGLKPYSAYPNVPITQTFAKTDEERHILVAIFSQMEIARTFAAPPGTPGDRVAILRTAFMAALNDPALVAEAQKLRLDLDPSSGEDVAKVIVEMSNLSADLKQKVRDAIGE
jgi:tripartite-type tricarboxylate transporter receptor subunit TctC